MIHHHLWQRLHQECTCTHPKLVEEFQLLTYLDDPTTHFLPHITETSHYSLELLSIHVTYCLACLHEFYFDTKFPYHIIPPNCVHSWHRHQMSLPPVFHFLSHLTPPPMFDNDFSDDLPVTWFCTWSTAFNHRWRTLVWDAHYHTLYYLSPCINIHTTIEGVHFSFPEFEWEFRFWYFKISIIVREKSMKTIEKGS